MPTERSSALFRSASLILLFLIAADQIAFIVRWYPHSAFIDVDPAAIFYGSVIGVLRNGRAFYHVDPASTYYIFLACTLLPLKLYSFFAGIDLVTLSHLAMEPILTYMQIVTMLSFLAGLFLVSRAAVHLAGREWVGPFCILFFFARHMVGSAWIAAVSAEAFLVFMSGAALFLFARYLRGDKRMRTLFLSSYAAGLGFAVKLTMLPVFLFIFFSLLFDVLSRKPKPRNRCTVILLFLFFTCAGFISAMIVARPHVFFPVTSAVDICMHAGPQSGGHIGIDTGAYITNLSLLLRGNRIILLTGICAALLALFGHSQRGAMRVPGRREVLLIGLIGLISSVVYITLMSVEAECPRYFLGLFLVEAVSLGLLLSLGITGRYSNAFIACILLALLFRGNDLYRSNTNNKYGFVKEQMKIEKLLKRNGVDKKRDRIVYMKHIPGKAGFLRAGGSDADGMYDDIIKRDYANILIATEEDIVSMGTNSVSEEWDYAVVNEDGGDFLKRYPSDILDTKKRIRLAVPRP